jgi:hypothetical protein
VASRALASQEAPTADLEANQPALHHRNGSFHHKGISLLNPGSIGVTRYRYRGSKIPTPWSEHQPNPRGLRARRGRYAEQLVLERVQQALS